MQPSVRLAVRSSVKLLAELLGSKVTVIAMQCIMCQAWPQMLSIKGLSGLLRMMLRDKRLFISTIVCVLRTWKDRRQAKTSCAHNGAATMCS